MCVCVCVITDEIDEISTRWGSDDSCSFYYYFPVVEITAAAFWIVMMVISGQSGARTNA